MCANPLRDHRVTDPVNFIYENAPLIEVIAEVRWALVPLTSMPGAAVDPLFPRASERFTEAVGKIGFSHVERLIPAEVPLEVVAYNPVLRYRREADKWPLFQIGPGLFSCNITLPYKGWTAFRSVIGSGLQALHESYEFGSVLVEPSMVHVRYINGFTAKHGMVAFADFCTADLNLGVALPLGVVGSVADPAGLVFSVEFGFPLAGMDGSKMGIKCAQGQTKGIPAAILELSVTRQTDLRLATNVPDILAWMDQAHTSIRGIFQQMTSPRLRDAMGPIKQVGRR